MDSREQAHDGICFLDADVKCGMVDERLQGEATEVQLREALSRAIPNIACRRRGSNKIIMGQSLQACDVWLLQQRQDLGRARILQVAVELQWLMLHDAGYDESMLQRAENDLHKLLHTTNDTLVEVLAEFFPELPGHVTQTHHLDGIPQASHLLARHGLKPATQHPRITCAARFTYAA